MPALAMGTLLGLAKPRLALHWPVAFPVTTLAPRACVGAGVLPWQTRLPRIRLRLMSLAAADVLRWIATFPPTVPLTATQAPVLSWHATLPPTWMPGPVYPLGCVQCWMAILPPTV